jgi:membrane protease YdiL (CAAX protease family)
MKKLWVNIYDWIRNPDTKRMDLSFRQKLALMMQILFLDVIISILFLGLTHLIHHKVIKLEEPLIDWNPFLLISVIVFILPVTEELVFRFPLRFERNYFARLIDWITKGWVKKRWDSFFRYILYSLIAVFGFMHLMNFENREPVFYVLSPILIGGQLVGGLILSYSRIKLGFTWAILQHCAFNLFFVLIGLTFFHNQSIVEISDEHLSIEIKELIYIDKDSSYYKSVSDSDLIYSIEANDISLFQLIDSLQTTGATPYDNIWIDIRMNSNSGATKNELLAILKRTIKFDK